MKSYRAALNEAMAGEMRRDSSVIVMGEDVSGGTGAPGEDDAWGGPLGVTKGDYIPESQSGGCSHIAMEEREMTRFSRSVRTQTCRDILNGVYDAAFEMRFGLKPGTIAVSQKCRQVVDSVDDVSNKISIPVVASSSESDSQKNLQREDGSPEVI